MVTKKSAVALVIKDLPRECSCGSKQGFDVCSDIGTVSGELFMQVDCTGCGKSFLIPDPSAIEHRGELKSKYYPLFLLNQNGQIEYADPRLRRDSPKEWEGKMMKHFGEDFGRKLLQAFPT